MSIRDYDPMLTKLGRDLPSMPKTIGEAVGIPQLTTLPAQPTVAVTRDKLIVLNAKLDANIKFLGQFTEQHNMGLALNMMYSLQIDLDNLIKTL